jgi:membrane fusion protein (multidrug efflux system)
VKPPLLSLLLLLAAGSGDRAAPSGTGVYPSHLMVDQEVIVASRITGIVEKVLVNRGSIVVTGQPLATLDPREADADVRQAKEQMDLQKLEFDRAQALSSGNVLSKSDLDDKRARYAVAVAVWEKAKAMRDYTVVRAPFNGVVTEKYARVGQKVIEDKEVPLFKVTALEPLLARIYVPEKELLNIHRGDPVEVIPTNFPKIHASGAVEFISPTVDAASGSFEVIVQVRRERSQTVLRPGLAVSVRLVQARQP